MVSLAKPGLPKTIQTVDDVREFFIHLHKKEGINFHPDDPFEGYIYLDSGTPCYTPEEEAIREGLMDLAHKVCDAAGTDIYEMGLEITSSPSQE